MEKEKIAQDYCLDIYNYICNIKDLNKRRKALNSSYEAYDHASPLQIIIRFHIHFYARKYLKEIIEFVIKNGADIRHKDQNQK